ncbi:hypothetical protein MUY27_17120 [Mucilaginibacter sp. RS28]|uniref:Uncharacterized protein n=1 Tax=Mucilaginibacter straminoryzae TaxID=2932774 RepID=A0A9X2BEI7_9SPHI|nr:hypothetical protein [Mucilaginibacter straminoryzae]MCJ8211443.1 hypothetical protein [Mucilaginibacter straminoryzae]
MKKSVIKFLQGGWQKPVCHVCRIYHICRIRHIYHIRHIYQAAIGFLTFKSGFGEWLMK